MVFKYFEPLLISVHLVLLFILPSFATILMTQHVAVLQAIVLTFSLFYTTLLSSIVIYRISPIHPLSRYPGPLHLKISKLSMAWIASGGKQHIYIAQLHEQYGDAVRIGQYGSFSSSTQLIEVRLKGPNEVSYRNFSAVVPLMGSNGLSKGPGKCRVS